MIWADGELMESEKENQNKAEFANTCKAFTSTSLNPSLLNSEEQKKFREQPDITLWKYSPCLRPCDWTSCEYAWFKWTSDSRINGNDEIGE